jgi:MFS superfamily sulfate permease-like transporter
MSISLIFLMSLVAVLAALVTLIRVLGWRRVLRNATWIDIGFTVVICLALAGTLTGLLIGIVAGLVMTGTLTAARWMQERMDAFRAQQAKPVDDSIWPGGSATSL